MNTTRLTNAPKTRQQLLADNNDHYDYDAIQQTPNHAHAQQLDILGAPVKQDNLNNDVIIDIRPVNLSAQFEDLANNDDEDNYYEHDYDGYDDHGNCGHLSLADFIAINLKNQIDADINDDKEDLVVQEIDDEDDFDPLDYDRPDKKLAAYDEALEQAYYLAKAMAQFEIEAINLKNQIDADINDEEEDLVAQEIEEDDDYDPLDYDRADKRLAEYDDALERAYLANANDFTIEYVEDEDQEFEEESNDMLTFDEWQAKINETVPNDGLSFDEWQAKMTEDRHKRSVEFFKSYDEDMDYHVWLQEQIELHKDDPEFQYNLQLFTYNNSQNERLYATEDAGILDDDEWNYPITDSVMLDHQVDETIEQLIVKLEAENAELFNNKPYHAISSSMPFRIGNENNV
jgi:hypothetical protein